MIQTKVSCWFCNEESHVFIVYKNSWTCKSCNQYNGFNKDGDYNKKMPEMQKENKKTFCMNNQPATPKKNVESTNLLCQRCNSSQEQKLKQLSDFDAKNEDNFDEEYKIYKQKLDHIYDLCRPCKMKLNQHLQMQNTQIGIIYNDQIENKQTTPLKTINRQSKKSFANFEKSEIQDSPLTKRSIAKALIPESESMDTSPVYKKAYTVAGVPAYTRERKNLTQVSQDRHHLIKNQSPKKYIFDEDMDSMNKKNDNDVETKVDKLLKTNLTKSMDKWFVIQTICGDFLSFFIILLILSCDIVNLINDSGIWRDVEYNSDFQLIPGAEQHYLFRTLLKTYKYNQICLGLILMVSVFFAYKRPKVSRFLTIIGLFFNFLIHMNFFSNQNDERFIMEVFVSFSLSSYLALARSYNLIQLYRYITNQ